MIAVAACQVSTGHLIPVLPEVVLRRSSYNPSSFFVGTDTQSQLWLTVGLRVMSQSVTEVWSPFGVKAQ